MEDLEAQLKQADADGARFKLITTDGVFSMDGYIAKLDEICDLADKYNALVHFDDAHATGYLGATGRGIKFAEDVLAMLKGLVQGEVGHGGLHAAMANREIQFGTASLG